MSIQTHEGELVESIGTTVQIKRDDLGEFCGVYYDEDAQKFVTVTGIDADASDVDCPTILMIRYVCRKQSKFRFPWQAWGVSKAQYEMIRSAYDDDPDDLSAVWRLLDARSNGVIVMPFFEKMARQLAEWIDTTHLVHQRPFSRRQMEILRRQKKYYEYGSAYCRRKTQGGRFKANGLSALEDYHGECDQPGRESPAESERHTAIEEADLR